MVAKGEPEPAPADFARAVGDIRAAQWRPELMVSDIPSPQRIAPYSSAITADVVVGDDELGNGRLVLLHDPAGNPAWHGRYRLVTFARADVDPEMVADPLLPAVGWSWLVDALGAHRADYLEPSGTVTAVTSESFGQMADEPARAEVEIRASWTPDLAADGTGLHRHLDAWADLLCTTAGLPPLPPGVVPMPRAARFAATGGARRRP